MSQNLANKLTDIKIFKCTLKLPSFLRFPFFALLFYEYINLNFFESIMSVKPKLFFGKINEMRELE